MKTKVYLYSACDVFYGSFYIYGFKNYFGNNNVVFNKSKFPEFPQNTFAAIVRQSKQQIKIIIDFNDSPEINTFSFDWCDVYGKINLTKEDYENEIYKNKIIPIGPSFAIKNWNLLKSFAIASSNFIKSYRVLHAKRSFFANYKRQYHRIKIQEYKKDKPQEDYIFALHSIWKKRAESANKNRLKFIKACKNIQQIDFEGGFAPRQNDDVEGYEEYTIHRRYSTREYIQKTKKSALVFNTPSVMDCHGWKLAEYLALGKSILSTPLSRVMPEELIDGKHFIILRGNDYTSKIEWLLKEESMRSSLENNAYNYYRKYLCPYAVIQRLITFAEK